MPMSQAFADRLNPVLQQAARYFGTPFHIYDERGIRETGRRLNEAFENVKGFKEFYAVKALPNPRVLEIMFELGFGFDCSSVPELVLSRSLGARGGDIMFTSNNTTPSEFEAALKDGGSILNLDDITLIDRVPRMPELICFRYNPGSRRTGNDIIGNPVEAKYGVSDDQIVDAYRLAMERGARRFGLHTMLCSNELNCDYMIETVKMLLEMVERISGELGIEFEFINMGGGLGIPYLPDRESFDVERLGRESARLLNEFERKHGHVPDLFMESGRFMTGPHGVLVTAAINKKRIYRDYVGVDACMSALMRPGMYDTYHHITVFGKDNGHPTRTVDVVGSLCENIDKFAKQRKLPEVEDGDLLLIHDTGAHAHAMGFNYNAKLRPKELLLRTDGSVELIRRAETMDDYFATLRFEPDRMVPDSA
jgi:diaminopimelate decarboxylase